MPPGVKLSSRWRGPLPPAQRTHGFPRTNTATACAPGGLSSWRESDRAFSEPLLLSTSRPLFRKRPLARPAAETWALNRLLAVIQPANPLQRGRRRRGRFLSRWRLPEGRRIDGAPEEQTSALKLLPREARKFDSSPSGGGRTATRDAAPRSGR